MRALFYFSVLLLFIIVAGGSHVRGQSSYNKNGEYLLDSGRIDGAEAILAVLDDAVSDGFDLGENCDTNDISFHVNQM